MKKKAQRGCSEKPELHIAKHTVAKSGLAKSGFGNFKFGKSGLAKFGFGNFKFGKSGFDNISDSVYISTRKRE